MEKKKVIAISILAVVVILIIVAVIIWVRSRNKDKKESGADEKPILDIPGLGAIFSGGGGASESFPLKKGMHGNNVMALQKAANIKCNAGLTEDGAWGPKTEEAFKKCFSKNSFNEAEFKQTTGTNPSTGTSSTAKVAYARYAGVRVLKSTNYSDIYKTAAANEWLGTVTGESGSFYVLNNIRYVEKQDAILK